MRAVTLGVSSIEDTQHQMAAAFGGEKVGEFISFAAVELLWKVLTAKRWDILQAMTGQGEMTIREIARRVDRDVKAVHGDVRALEVARA
jgi:predicted transcriptional regulator